MRQIVDLDKRRKLWNRDHIGPRVPYGKYDLLDSLPYPFESADLGDIFTGKDVLEIGPGNGRQYERVRNKARTYSIADISPAALGDPTFNQVTSKYLLTSWHQDLNRKFDVIHFWYVLHHIRQDEMGEFFAFICRHLRESGIAAFNCPEPINVQGDPNGDGLGTSYSDPGLIEEKAPLLKIVEQVYIGQKSTGHVFLMCKGSNNAADNPRRRGIHHNSFHVSAVK